MKQFNFKSILPHLIAVGVFLLVAVIFCKPALETDVVMQQHDYTAADAMKHQSYEYKKVHGVLPLWVSSMFSGMPAYNIIFDGPSTPIQYIDTLFQFGLPKPLNFFFLASICFYFFALTLRVRPYIAIFAALAYAYSTYNPIITVAGHDTKMLAMAYAPALLGGVLLIFEKYYRSGFILTALFSTLHIAQNHQQISYYLLLIILVMGIFYLVRWIKAGETGHLAKVIPIALGGAIIGVAANALILFPVADYAKYSKRGGQLVMDEKIDAKSNKIESNKTIGLTKEYALDWSYGKVETLSLMFQGITGHGTHVAERDGEYAIFPKLDEKSNVANYIQEKFGAPEDQAAGFAMNTSTSVYWGDKTFTTGSVYLGAVIVVLFLLGLMVVPCKHRGWLVVASLLGIILAWGKHLPEINYFLFDYLPLYNKFRTPEMALVIPQLLFPALAALAVETLAEMDPAKALKSLKLGAVATAALFVIAGGLYLSLDYSKENKERTRAMSELAAKLDDPATQAKMQEINIKYPAQTDNRVFESFLFQAKGDTQAAQGLVNALRKDRAEFFKSDIIRSLIFSVLTLLLVFLLIRRTLPGVAVFGGLALLTAADLLPKGMEYINDKAFINKDQQQSTEFGMSQADQIILKDKDPNFRVYNVSGGDPFQDAKTSYYHKSIGGYHPAKMGIYDDLIAYQLGGATPNPAVLNMLNTKYLIDRSEDGKGVVAIPNMGALGNCWFVDGIQYVVGPVAEMKAMNDFNPADTAIADKQFQTILGNAGPVDSTASIKQTAFDNMKISYSSSNPNAGVAVFSEVFYKDWNAYIDGKPAPIARVNYVLRALHVPAGNHTIEFRFEPKVFQTSYTISLITGWLLFVLLIGGLFLAWRESKASDSSTQAA